MPRNPIAKEIQHLAVSVADLHLWPNNPRVGDVGAIAESLKRFGQVRPILVAKDTMQIVAGNHVYRAACALGYTEIAAVVMDIDGKQAKALVAADNRVSELGGFDEVELAKMLADIARNDTLEGTGYDADDLDALLAKIGNPNKTGFGDPDSSSAPPASPWVKEGQIFQLGEHRVACGDGGDDQLLGALIGRLTVKLLIVQPTTVKGASNPKEIFDTFDSIPEQFWFEPHKYDLWQVGPDIGVGGKGSFLIWDKQSEHTDRDFAEAFELIYSKMSHRQEILRHTFLGAADGEKHGGADFNERPTALFMNIFERWSRFESVVLDPYALGATAMLAAEKTGRRYLGMKRDPGHVQAMLEKWTSFSGSDPVEITTELA